MNDNAMTQLPANRLQACNTLVTLYLDRNFIKVIGESSFIITNVRLTTLTLKDNGLHTIDPNAFIPLIKLRNLKLETNNLTSFPFLPKVRYRLIVTIHDNKIERMVDANVFTPPWWTYRIYADNNQMSNTSAFTSTLHRMEWLSLTNNNISYFTASYPDTWVVNYKQIWLHDNPGLSWFPDIWGWTMRTRIRNLTLWNDNISCVDQAHLYRFTMLTTLYLQSNKLRRFLTGELCDRPEPDVPDEYRAWPILNNMATMRLDANELSELPEFASFAANLVTLRLENNQITVLAQNHVKELDKLQELYLMGNPLCFIELSFDMVALVELELTSCPDLTQLPNFSSLISHRESLNITRSLTVTMDTDNRIECGLGLCWMTSGIPSGLIYQPTTCISPLDGSVHPLDSITSEGLGCGEGW